PPTRGRGSKLPGARFQIRAQLSPPTRGRGSKPLRFVAPNGGLRRPPHGGVDRNTPVAVILAHEGVAPHTGAWIETSARSHRRWRSRVAPPPGAWIETHARSSRPCGS